MAAASARALLLGDLQGVLGVARRRFGFLLTADANASKRCENVAELSPALVLRPLLDLVRLEHASSTLTAAALEAVRSFLGAWPWPALRDTAAVADALADVVDAVSQCRFQETSAESDQRVVGLVVAVLRAVLASPAARCLSDHAMWQLVESLYALSRASRSDRYVTLSLRASAASALHDAIQFLFASPAVYAASASVGFGLPCAVKTLGFLCQKLHQRSGGGVAGAGGASPAAARRDVALALDLLRTLLLACDARQLTREPSLMLFVKDDLCSGLLRFSRLGACADTKIPLRCLELVRLLWTKLRSVLKMQLEALFNGVFCHALHWTIAHLDAASPNLASSAPGGAAVVVQRAVPAMSRAVLSGEMTTAAAGRRRVDAATDEFTGELLPLSRLFAASFEVLDCLVDLFAEPTLLPDLYANYDCDGNRSDLTLDLFELLALTVRHSHVACRDTLDEPHFLWAQGVGELALRGLFNALYVVYVRSQHRHPRTTTAATMTTTTTTLTTGVGGIPAADDDDSNDDDGLLLDERVSSPRTSNTSAVGFATADALYRRRQRKKFFQHGIQEFNRKPLAGIKYLQQNAFLPTPLDAPALAAFLRSLPQGLHKDAVGMYLGAMGKDVKEFERAEIHEADTMAFHRAVLAQFVESFNFEGESIVAALRMFLASFRLPGEAQQIDRILNTFSLQVYAQCRERSLLASADVAYLLSFSLIMLNTDLHNPNIRPEKKMTRDDFVRNNRNYGRDVSAGRDLPDDFLTELYAAIASDEIKTFEDGGRHGEVTTDRWKDLLHQAENDPQHSRLIVHYRLDESATREPPRHHHLHAQRHRPHGSPVDDNTEAGESLSPPPTLRAGDQYDRHIFELVQSQLVQAFASVFEQFATASNSDDGLENVDGALPPESSGQALYIPERSMLQLACNGLVLCAGAAARLALPEHVNAVFARVCQYTGLFPSAVYPLGYSRRDDGVWLFCNNPSASMAAAGMLKLVGTCSLWLTSASWVSFFHALSTLREFQALPAQLLRVTRPGTRAGATLTAAERADFVALVHENKEEIRRRNALKRQEESALSGASRTASGFFSGVAWLMSAFDAYPSSSDASASASSDGLGFEPPRPRNPVEWAENAYDLVLAPAADDARSADSSNSDDDAEFGTDAWIRAMLEPFRLEFLIQDLASLPVRVLVEIVKALDGETMCALSGSPPRLQDAAAKRASSSRKLQASEEDAAGAASALTPSRVLSPAGCVLFEHLLSQILSESAACDGGEAMDDDDVSLLRVLEAHYTGVLQVVLPILSSSSSGGDSDSDSAPRISFENACFVLAKAIDGVFTLASKLRSERSRGLLTQFLVALVDASADDELVRPFLSQLLSGLRAFFASAAPASIRYTREQWLVLTSLVDWSVDTALAAPHGFALVECLVAARVWRVDDSEIAIDDCFTSALMFALAFADSGDSDDTGPNGQLHRALALLHSLFCTLDADDTRDDALRLHFVGGAVMVSRELVKRNHELALDDDSAQQSLTEAVVASLGVIRGMLSASGGDGDATPVFDALSWLDILQHGLLPLGVGILDPRASANHSIDATRTPSRVLFYEQQLGSAQSQSATASSSSSPSKRDTPKQLRAGAARRRRPSVVKDPLVLRPHVLLVQLVSGVVCAELSRLAPLDAFAGVWDATVDLLIGLLRHTQLDGSDAPSSELALAALERRSALSAHEEILEHVKAVARRLSALEHDERRFAVGDGHDTATTFPALIHSLVDKCRPVPGLFDLLFPPRDDTRSAGELTPPQVLYAGVNGDGGL
ncbi:hypothetical protein PybrP1_006115 [[Pythium] brassicae (nom. inval.)]|nr:hypothetical protein PybrP1_006115 [[Pythium] brassicae (nom. inval.)]